MIELAQMRAAQERIKGVALRTPLIYSDALSRDAGASVYVKAESLQPMGAFKLRGATNRLRTLSDAQRAAGVVTASSGNHAQGISYAARALGVQAVVVMPEAASPNKIDACRAYGAEVVLHGVLWEDAWARANELSEQRGLSLVHPFDDWDLIAGQSTVGLEILEDIPNADVVLVPIGGGGLIAGVAAAIKAVRPATRVVGVQSRLAASSVLSWRNRQIVETPEPKTIAEGIKVKRPGERNFGVMLRCVDDMVEVEDDDLRQAVLYSTERLRLTGELSGVGAIAALLTGRIEAPGQRVVAVLSGGNVSVTALCDLATSRS